MSLSALKTRLAELYPGTDPLTAEQVDTAYATLSAETETVTEPTRITLLSVANVHGNELATRLAESLRAAASTDGYVDEIVQLLRNGQGVDISHDAAKAMLDTLAENSELPLTADDVTAIVGMAQVEKPKWPRLSVERINKARAL